MKKIDIEKFIDTAVDEIRQQSKGLPILLALSGGVDSSVCAVLANRAVGDRLTCVFVDTGFMRLDEGKQVKEMFTEQFPTNLVYVDAEKRYLEKLKGIVDPEQKRTIIGNEFIRIFEEEARSLGEIGCFVQGTIYPDIMESGKDGKGLVKTHHNTALPFDIKFKKIIEPIKYLYKEQVRELAVALGLPKSFAYRQPFPGPGLAVRVLGELTKQRLDTLRHADNIFTTELEKAGLDAKQYFAVLPNCLSVGVRNSSRCYESLIALRAVKTTDFVSGSVVHLPYDFLEKVVKRITSEVSGVNRVVYDITPKPPGTIEWE